MALLDPTIGILLTSPQTPIASALVDEDDAGGVRTRGMFSGRASYFVRQYDYITAANVVTLRAFYATNRTISFTQTWIDGVTYTCKFTGEGAFFDLRTGSFFYGWMSMATTGPV